MNAHDAGLKALIDLLIALGASADDIAHQVAAFERVWAN